MFWGEKLLCISDRIPTSIPQSEDILSSGKTLRLNENSPANGYLNDLKYWSSTLSQDEVSQLAFSNEELIAHWCFDDISSDSSIPECTDEIQVNPGDSAGVVSGDLDYVLIGTSIEDLCCYDSENDADEDGVCGDVEECPGFEAFED